MKNKIKKTLNKKIEKASKKISSASTTNKPGPMALLSKSKITGRNLKYRPGYSQHSLKKKEKYIEHSAEIIKNNEILLKEKGSVTGHAITQSKILEQVDITTIKKGFCLSLDEYGPYRFRYSRNGRHICLGGEMGHIASFDALTKKLSFEINVMQSVHDVCYLHNEQQVAVAQNDWTYIYDSAGVEIHCIKGFHRMCRLEFLNYHWLLCGSSDRGYIKWVDTSMGKELLSVNTQKGPLEIMGQNPYNAVIVCGHSNGTVSMWTPNSNKAAASVLCHPTPLTSLAFDPYGRYMATAGLDKTIKLFDNRKLGQPLSSHRIKSATYSLAMSQTGLVSACVAGNIEIYKNLDRHEDNGIYMKEKMGGVAKSLYFCPYEDVLGVSGYEGFTSLIVPGSGEPNFDSYEANPFISKAGRREGEIKSLLEKIPHTFITLNPSDILQIDLQKQEEKVQVNYKKREEKDGKESVLDRFRRKK